MMYEQKVRDAGESVIDHWFFQQVQVDLISDLLPNGPTALGLFVC